MTNVDDLADRVKSYTWYHHIPLAEGVITPGQAPAAWQKEELPSFNDQTVLDIGAWDGGYSFLAEREGASRVVALDHYVWGIKWAEREAYWSDCAARGILPDHGRDSTDFWDDSLPGRRPFDFAREVLGSRVESIVADFRTVDLASVGKFDVVLYLGVLYHMPEPLTCLRRVREVTRRVAAVGTVAVDVPGLNDQRLMQFETGNELGGDFGNWFVPSTSALVGLCLAAGFSRVEIIVGPPPAPAPEGGTPQAVHRYGAMVHAYVD